MNSQWHEWIIKVESSTVSVHLRIVTLKLEKFPWTWNPPACSVTSQVVDNNWGINHCSHVKAYCSLSCWNTNMREKFKVSIVSDKFHQTIRSRGAAPAWTMQQYVFKCVRSHTTSPIQCAWEGRGGSTSLILFLFLIHLIWGLQCSGRPVSGYWLAGWSTYFIHWLILYDILLPPSLLQIKLRNAIAIGFQNPVQSLLKGNFIIIIKCSRNICDLPSPLSPPDILMWCQPSYYSYIYYILYYNYILCIMIKIGILWRMQPADHLNLWKYSRR